MRLTELHAMRPVMTANLLRLYQTRTVADVDAGARWYPDTHAIMCEWATYYGRSVAVVSAVTAALSPQCVWERNLVAADDVLAGRPVSVYGPLPVNVVKAETLARRDSHDLASVFVCAPKVMSFACNLAGVWDVVTVDNHAAQAALASPLEDIRLVPTHYAVYAECYRVAARHVGVLPAEFQATIWCLWKRMYPAGRKRYLRRTRTR